jgi:Peptidase A4 family
MNKTRRMKERVAMRRLMVSLVSATALAFGFTTLAAAQSTAARAVYDASAIVSTNVPGIRTFNAPPAGFNPLTASDEELAAYGFPPRPDSENDAEHYAKWARAMAAAKTRWNGELKVTGSWSKAARPAQAPAGAPAISAGPSTGFFYNWSGFINTNTLQKYSTTNSFYFVVSDFNVPVAQQAFRSDGFETGNVCDGGWDLEVNWNGIDGFTDGSALLRGGTLSGAYCSGRSTSTDYFAWIEWWPSFPIIGEFNVNPGDDFFVETWDTSATQGYFFLDDETTQTYAVYGISPNKGQPGLIGNSAEYIVERPCCRGSNDFPLANYVQDFWATSYAYNFYEVQHGIATPYYPGSTLASTVLANMVDDAGDQVISYPEAQGKYGIFFQDEHCAEYDGCVP